VGIVDIIVFIMFVICVVSLGLWKSRNETSSEDYFLAGRGLKWWLIGFSLIAANISSEQFVGMSGNAASHIGLAIASFEWLAAITLVVVAFFFLPYFLKAGIYTMPEFLEYRYNHWARLAMAVSMLLIYMLLLGAVTYSGALTVNTMAEEMGVTHIPSIAQASLVIGLIAMIYVATGGLKACAWADLIQGSALIIGGAIIVVFAFKMLGGVPEAAYIENVTTGAVAVKTFTPAQGAIERFLDLNKVRLNMFLPNNDSVLPWTALLLGLWIPNFYYWGLNQYITQRTLGSASLAEGQKGIIFSAFMKLLIPFAIVIPGIVAFNLFSSEMKSKAVYDNAPVMARYKMANPQTQMVQIMDSPSLDILSNWQKDTFIIAVFPDKATLEATKVKNPFVLPMMQEEYNKLVVKPHSLFKTDDKSLESIFPALCSELKAYNKTIEEAATQSGAATHIEKLIGYKYDSALGQLLSKVLPRNTGLAGFVLAALLGAVVSSLAAMLNAASTIFTMDIYAKYIQPMPSQKTSVLLGRLSVFVFAGIAVLLAPALGNPRLSHSIFMIIQESQAFIGPGIVAVFVLGFSLRRAPRCSGVIGLLGSIVIYGVLKYISTIEGLMTSPAVGFLIGSFLNRMAVTFILCIAVIVLLSLFRPLSEPVEFKVNNKIELHSSRMSMFAGVIVVVLTLILYVIFSPIGIAKP